MLYYNNNKLALSFICFIKPITVADLFSPSKQNTVHSTDSEYN